MNERIRELAKQATTITYEEDGWRLYGTEVETFNKEKFAELIVRECARLCEHKSNDDEYDQYDMGMSVKAENIKASIMKEFGVE